MSESYLSGICCSNRLLLQNGQLLFGGYKDASGLFVGHTWVLWDAGLGHADIFFKITSFQQFSLEHSSMPDARYIMLSLPWLHCWEEKGGCGILLEWQNELREKLVLRMFEQMQSCIIEWKECILSNGSFRDFIVVWTSQSTLTQTKMTVTSLANIIQWDLTIKWSPSCC